MDMLKIENVRIYEDLDRKALFEKAPVGRSIHGFTRNYIRAELPARESNDAFDNQIVRVSLGDFNHNKTALKATPING